MVTGIHKITGIGPKTAEYLSAQGIATAEGLLEAGLGTLVQAPGFSQARADKVMQATRELLAQMVPKKQAKKAPEIVTEVAAVRDVPAVAPVVKPLSATNAKKQDKEAKKDETVVVKDKKARKAKKDNKPKKDKKDKKDKKQKKVKKGKKVKKDKKHKGKSKGKK